MLKSWRIFQTEGFDFSERIDRNESVIETIGVDMCSIIIEVYETIYCIIISYDHQEYWLFLFSKSAVTKWRSPVSVLLPHCLQKHKYLIWMRNIMNILHNSIRRTKYQVTCTNLSLAWPIPCPEPVYTGWSSVHWNATGMPLVDPVYTGIPLGEPANTCRVHLNTTGKTYLKQPHTGMPLEKLSWKCPTLRCHWINTNFSNLHWNTAGKTVTAHTRPGTYS